MRAPPAGVAPWFHVSLANWSPATWYGLYEFERDDDFVERADPSLDFPLADVFVEILPACQRPCVELRLWAEGEWRGPPPPYNSRGLAGIACHAGIDSQSPYATRFSYDDTTGIAEFECDGEGGLHLAGQFTQVFADSAAAARGLFGPDSSLVLSATGDAAQLLGSVLDPAGTDLWPLLSEPPYWVRNEYAVYSPSPLQGDLPADYDASLGAAPSAWFEAASMLPARAADAESERAHRDEQHGPPAARLGVTREDLRAVLAAKRPWGGVDIDASP